MVVRTPPVASACPTASSWPSVLECVKTHGLIAKELSSVDNMKLIAVTAGDNLEGFALYIQDPRKLTWHLGGLLQESGDLRDYSVLRLEKATAGKDVFVYRFDVASSQASYASISGVTSKSAIYRSVTATFCHGLNYSCYEVVPKCEQIVNGQTLSAFDGNVTMKGNQLIVRGTGTEPGCSAAGEYYF
jgi:hypothetical protein